MSLFTAITAQALRDRLVGVCDVDAPMAIAAPEQPITLPPDARQQQLHARLALLRRYRLPMFALSLLTYVGIIGVVASFAPDRLSIWQLIALLATPSVGLLAGGVAVWAGLAQYAIAGKVQLSIDATGLMIKTEGQPTQQVPFDELRSDGRWLKAGDHFLPMTRKASKPEQKQFGCQWMPRYQRDRFLAYLLPQLHGERLVSSNSLKASKPNSPLLQLVMVLLVLSAALLTFNHLI